MKVESIGKIQHICKEKKRSFGAFLNTCNYVLINYYDLQNSDIISLHLGFFIHLDLVGGFSNIFKKSVYI